MSVAAGLTPVTGDGDFTVSPLSVDYRDHGSSVRGLVRNELTHCMTFRTGALRRVEIGDRSIKELLV